MGVKYITITEFDEFYGLKPFGIGNILTCIKESSDPFDPKVMKVILPYIGTIGFVANTKESTIGGTTSASRIFHYVRKKFFVRVLFTCECGIICKLEDEDTDVIENEIIQQAALTVE